MVSNLSQNYSNMVPGGAIPLPPRLKDRGTSLPPSALPRPPRSLKPPRKIDYDRLSDSELKARSQTPPKLLTPSPYEIKTSSLKRGEFSRRDYASPNKNYVEMKEVLYFPNPHFSLKRKDYGSMNKTEFSKPEYTSTKYYQRLDDSPKMNKASPEPNGYKRSLLPSVRKYSPAPNQNKQSSRDSLNSSESNNSVVSNLRQSPIHLKIEPNASSVNFHQHASSRTPPKYLSLAAQEKSFLSGRQQSQQPPSPTKSGSLVPCGSNANSMAASLPPKPVDNRSGRRGSSMSRGENRYRIQF